MQNVAEKLIIFREGGGGGGDPFGENSAKIINSIFATFPNELRVFPLKRSGINWQNLLRISVQFHSISCLGWNWFILFPVSIKWINNRKQAGAEMGHAQTKLELG